MYDVGAGFWVILHTTEGISSQGFCDGGHNVISHKLVQKSLDHINTIVTAHTPGKYTHQLKNINTSSLILSVLTQQCEGDKVPLHTSNHHLGSNRQATGTWQLLARSQEAVQNSPLEQGL